MRGLSLSAAVRRQLLNTSRTVAGGSVTRVLITVHVKPGSSKGPLVDEHGDPDGHGGADYTVYVRERAVDGSANAAVQKVLAAHFGVGRRSVEIVRGHSSRIKAVRIDTEGSGGL